MSLNTRYFFYYDLAFIGVCIVLLVFAYRKGFIRQLTDITTYILSFIFAFFISPALGNAMPIFKTESNDLLIGLIKQVTLPMVNTFLWFLIVLLGLRILYRILVLIFHKKKKGVLSFANHLLGLGLGFVKIVLFGFTLSLILRFPLIQYGDVYLENSVLSFWTPSIQMMIDYWGGISS